MCFVQVVLKRLDAVVVVAVLASLGSIEVFEAVDLFVVAGTFFFEFAELEAKCVDVFSETVAAVGLGLDIALRSENFSFFARNLFTRGSDLTLKVIVVTVLLVEMETRVVNFLFEPSQRDQVRVKTDLEVVVLEQLFVLQVAILGLNCVELVTKSQIVFVALLNFKDLGFELGNQQIFLVARQVDAVVILQNLRQVFHLLGTF